MAIKIAIANQKGGIGKTTTALCLAAALQRKGKKVLFIDTDPQMSATGVYGAVTNDIETLYNMVVPDRETGECLDASQCIQNCALGHIIPSDDLLKRAETSIPVDSDRFYRLGDACKNIEKHYDYIVFDTPPGDGVLLGNVLSYTDYIVMPITADKFGIQGMLAFNETLNTFKKRINPGVKIAGILEVKYKGRQTLTKDLESKLIPKNAEDMDTIVFKTKIRESVKCQEAQALGESIFEYASSCTTAKDYIAFCDELLARIKKLEGKK